MLLTEQGLRLQNLHFKWLHKEKLQIHGSGERAGQWRLPKREIKCVGEKFLKQLPYGTICIRLVGCGSMLLRQHFSDMLITKASIFDRKKCCVAF